MRFAIAAALALIAAPSLHAQTVASPPTLDLGAATPIAGHWVYAQSSDGSEASFVNASALAQLTIRCLRAPRRVTIARPASTAAPFLTVWTDAGVRNLPASFNPATGRISADVAAFDPFLDAVAFSRGRFGVAISGQPALVVSAWAEPQRVIEDCRV